MTKTKNSAEFTLPDSLVAEILTAMRPPVSTGPGGKRRAAMRRSLLARVQAASADDDAIDLVHDFANDFAISAAGARIVRADEGAWITFAPNVAMKVLHDDGDTRTWLARFQAGGCVPAHLQSGDEEAYVVAGWCYVDRQIFRQGDYQLIPKGSRHGEIVSPEGCLVFVRSHSAKRSAAELAVAR
ncbi:MAG: cupin domain-containing protein [Betaproteobacteria bacterium]